MRKTSLLLFAIASLGIAISACETSTPDPVINDPTPDPTCMLSMVADKGDQVIHELNYDGQGRVVRVINELGTTTYPNDFWQNRNSRKAVLYNSFNLRSEFSFRFDTEGNLIERKLTDSLTGQIRFWDYTYNAEGKLIEVLESKENPGSAFKQQQQKVKYTHAGENVFREEVFTIVHNPGSSPQAGISVTREYSYDSNKNPYYELFFNGPALITLNKNNVVLIKEIPAGGSFNNIPFSYEFNDEKYPTIQKDGFGVVVHKYQYTDC